MIRFPKQFKDTCDLILWALSLDPGEQRWLYHPDTPRKYKVLYEYALKLHGKYLTASHYPCKMNISPLGEIQNPYLERKDKDMSLKKISKPGKGFDGMTFKFEKEGDSIEGYLVQVREVAMPEEKTAKIADIINRHNDKWSFFLSVALDGLITNELQGQFIRVTFTGYQQPVDKAGKKKGRPFKAYDVETDDEDTISVIDFVNMGSRPVDPDDEIPF